METKVTIENELKRRTDLIENQNFIKLCIELVKKIGISSDEWNNNKSFYLMYFANEYCKLENK